MELKGKYLINSGVEPKFVNGAYGGVGFNNELIINFFYERFNYPDFFSIIEENGKPPQYQENEKEIQIIREFCSSITMTLDTAKKINKWIGEQIVKIEQGNKNE